jgi:hypothetical protein
MYIWPWTGTSEISYYASGWSQANSNSFQTYPAQAALSLIRSVELYIGGQLIETIPQGYIQIINDLDVPNEQQASLSNLYQVPITSTSDADCYLKIPFSLDQLPVCALGNQTVEILVNIGNFNPPPTTTDYTSSIAIGAVPDDYVLANVPVGLGPPQAWPIDSFFTYGASSNVAAAANVFVGTSFAYYWTSDPTYVSGNYTGTKNLGGIYGEWITVTFPFPITPTMYSLFYKYSANSPTGWTFLGSNDGTTWTVLDTVTGYPVNPTNAEMDRTVTAGAYTTFGLVITTSRANSAVIGKWIVTGSSIISEPSRVWVNKHTPGYAADASSNSENLAIFDFNSIAWTSDPNYASGIYIGSSPRGGEWIQLTLPTPISISYYYTICNQATTLKLYGSNDLINWTLIDQQVRYNQVVKRFGNTLTSGFFSTFQFVFPTSSGSTVTVTAMAIRGYERVTTRSVQQYTNGILVNTWPVPGSTVIGTDYSNVYTIGPSNIWQNTTAYDLSKSQVPNVLTMTIDPSATQLWVFTAQSMQVSPLGTTWKPVGYVFPYAGAYLSTVWQSFVIVAVAIGIVILTTPGNYQAYQTPWGPPLFLQSNYYVTSNALVEWTGSYWTYVGQVSSPSAMSIIGSNVYVFSGSSYVVFTGTSVSSPISLPYSVVSASGEYLGGPSGVYDLFGGQLFSVPVNQVFTYTSGRTVIAAFDGSGNVYNYNTFSGTFFSYPSGFTGNVFFANNFFTSPNTSNICAGGSNLLSVSYTDTIFSQLFFDGRYMYSFASNLYVYDTFGSFTDAGSHYRLPFSANVQSVSFDGRYLTTLSNVTIASIDVTNFNVAYYPSTLVGNVTAASSNLVASDAGVMYQIGQRSQSISNFALQGSIGSYTDGTYIYAFSSNLQANGYVQYSPVYGSTVIKTPFSSFSGTFFKVIPYQGLVYLVSRTSLIVYNPTTSSVTNSVSAPSTQFSNAVTIANGSMYLFPLSTSPSRTTMVVNLSTFGVSYISPPSTLDLYTTACFDGTNIYVSNGSAVYTVSPLGDYFAQTSVWKPGSLNFGNLARTFQGNVISVTSTNVYIKGQGTVAVNFGTVPLMSRETSPSIYFLAGSNLYTNVTTSFTTLPVAGKNPVDITASASNVWVSWSDGTLGRLDTTAPSPLYYSTSTYTPSGTINATAYLTNVFALVNSSNLVDIGARSTTSLIGTFKDLAVFQNQLYVLPSMLGSNVYCNGSYFKSSGSFNPPYGGKLVTSVGIYVFDALSGLSILVQPGSVTTSTAFTVTSAMYLNRSNVYAVPALSNIITRYDETLNNFTNSNDPFTQTVTGALAAYKDWFVTSTGYSNAGVTVQQAGLLPSFAGPWLATTTGNLFVNVDSNTVVQSTSYGTFDRMFYTGANVYLANANGTLQIFNGTSSVPATSIRNIIAVAESPIYGTFLSNGSTVNILGQGNINVSTGPAASNLTADGSIIFAGSNITFVTPGISNVFNYQSAWGIPDQSYSCVFTYNGYTYLAPSNGLMLVQISNTSTLNSMSMKYHSLGGSSSANVFIGLDSSSNINFVVSSSAGLSVVSYNPNVPFDNSIAWYGTGAIGGTYTFGSVGNSLAYAYPGRLCYPIPFVYQLPYYKYTCPVTLVSPVSTQLGNTLYMYSQSNLVTFTTDTFQFSVTSWPYTVAAATTVNSQLVAIETSNIAVDGTRYPFVNVSTIKGTCFDGRFLSVLTSSNVLTFDSTNWAAPPVKGPSYSLMQLAGTTIYTGSNVLSFNPRPYTETSWGSPLTGLVGTYAIQGSNLINFITGTTLTTGLSSINDSLLNGTSAVFLGSKMYIWDTFYNTLTTLPVSGFELATDGTSYYAAGPRGVTKVYQDLSLATANVFSNATYLFVNSGVTQIGNLTSYTNFSLFSSVGGLYTMVLPFRFTNMGATGSTGPTSITYGASTPGYGTANVLTLSGGIQYWTVPFTGLYTIEAGGASTPGGSGAVMSNTVTLTQGTVISILVGQQSTGLTGAGGTFVVNGSNALVVAGGAGAYGSAIFSIGAQGNSGAGFSSDGPATNSFLHGGVSSGGGFGGGGVTTSGGLYAFGSFTFTPAGATGPTGPTQAQMRASASAFSSYVFSGTFSNGNFVTGPGGIWQWQVPVTGLYSFTVAGAGVTNPFSVNSIKTGYGFVMTDSVQLSRGDLIAMLVGQSGLVSGGSTGGCGGSFVYNVTRGTLLFVAGGAGGIGYESDAGHPAGITANGSVNGVAGTTGQNGGGWYDSGAGQGAGTGGTGPNGGTAAGNYAYVWGDCGAGYSGNGAPGRYGGSGPVAFINGGQGSTASGVYGGFGGGGCGGGYSGGEGGGGGGYGGGGAGGSDGQGCGGGGGGSYSVNGTVQGSATNSDQGYITVSVTIPGGGGGWYGGDSGQGGSSFGLTGSTYNTGPGYVLISASQSGTSYGVNAVGTSFAYGNVQASIVTDDVYFFGVSNVAQTASGNVINLGVQTDVFNTYQDGSIVYGVPATSGNVVTLSGSFNVPGGPFTSMVDLNGSKYFLSSGSTSVVLDPASINTSSWSQSYFLAAKPVSLFSYGAETVFSTATSVIQVPRNSTVFLPSSAIYKGTNITACFYDGRYIKIFDSGKIRVIDTSPAVSPTNLFVSCLVDSVLLSTSERNWFLSQNLTYVVQQIQTTPGLTANGFYQLYLTGPTTELLLSNTVTSELFLNGYSKSKLDTEYLQTLAPFWNYPRTPTTGVSVIPLEPYVNMSRVREQMIYLESTAPVTIFAKTLNVLRITDGLGGLVFVGRSR